MSQMDEEAVEVDQGIVFPLLTSGASDNEVGEVSHEYCCQIRSFYFLVSTAE